jgi:hypothetical protein
MPPMSPRLRRKRIAGQAVLRHDEVGDEAELDHRADPGESGSSRACRRKVIPGNGVASTAGEIAELALALQRREGQAEIVDATPVACEQQRMPGPAEELGAAGKGPPALRRVATRVRNGRPRS